MRRTSFLQKFSATVSFLVCILCVPSPARDSASFPAEIVSAKTINVMAQQGTSGTARIRPDAHRAKAQVEEALRTWGRYQLVESPAKADLVLIVVEGNADASQPDAAHPSMYTMTSMQLLSDSLVVYKGGGIKEDSKPLWRYTETGEDLGWPAERAVAKMREEVRKAELKSATTIR